MPPHCVPFETVMFGLALLFSAALVAAMSRTSAGFACQSSATTPTTCGPAIDVPEKDAYAESLVFVADRFGFPGAAMSGLIRPDPSSVTGPRLLKLARLKRPVFSAAVEYEAE